MCVCVCLILQASVPIHPKVTVRGRDLGVISLLQLRAHFLLSVGRGRLMPRQQKHTLWKPFFYLPSFVHLISYSATLIKQRIQAEELPACRGPGRRRWEPYLSGSEEVHVGPELRFLHYLSSGEQRVLNIKVTASRE